MSRAHVRLCTFTFSRWNGLAKCTRILSEVRISLETISKCTRVLSEVRTSLETDRHSSNSAITWAANSLNRTPDHRSLYFPIFSVSLPSESTSFFFVQCQEVMASARAEQGAPQRALKSGLVDLIRYHLEGSRINAWRKKEVDVDLLPLPEGRRVAPPSKALTLQQYIRLDGQ